MVPGCPVPGFARGIYICLAEANCNSLAPEISICIREIYTNYFIKSFYFHFTWKLLCVHSFYLCKPNAVTNDFLALIYIIRLEADFLLYEVAVFYSCSLGQWSPFTELLHLFFLNSYFQNYGPDLNSWKFVIFYLQLLQRMQAQGEFNHRSRAHRWKRHQSLQGREYDWTGRCDPINTTSTCFFPLFLLCRLGSGFCFS